jgi:hypothetical protein
MERTSRDGNGEVGAGRLGVDLLSGVALTTAKWGRRRKGAGDGDVAGAAAAGDGEVSGVGVK